MPSSTSKITKALIFEGRCSLSRRSASFPRNVAIRSSARPTSRTFHSVVAAASGNQWLLSQKQSSLNTNPAIANPWTLAARPFSSDNKRDFYEVLGVDRNADKATIKKAYFKLAKQYHPDTNKGDDTAGDKFKEATAAYEVLSDEKQREMYNNFGHQGVDPNFQGGNPFEGFGGGGGFDFGNGSFHFAGGQGGGQEIDPEEIFDMFFGGGGRKKKNRGPRRGSDLQMHVRLNFKEAVFGCEKLLNLRYQHVNRKTGEVSLKEREVTVSVPAGIDNGHNLRMTGQGAEGDPGAPAGNLLVQVLVEPDNYFERDGYDVHTKASVSFVQAILGGHVDVKTLDGEVELKIPKGCQPNTKLMLRGKGIQEINSVRKGDHIVHVAVEIPKTVTERQEKLLRQFDGEDESCSTTTDDKKGPGFAKAASSAFDKLFGSKNKKNQNNNSSKNENGENNEETVEEKKTA